MSLRDSTQTPNHGWQFTQIQTGWEMPTPLAWTRKQAVEQIIKHRLKNPAIVAKHNLATDFSTVEEELLIFTKARLGLPEGDGPPPPAPGSAPKRSACCGG